MCESRARRVRLGMSRVLTICLSEDGGVKTCGDSHDLPGAKATAPKY